MTDHFTELEIFMRSLGESLILYDNNKSCTIVPIPNPDDQPALGKQLGDIQIMFNYFLIDTHVLKLHKKFGIVYVNAVITRAIASYIRYLCRLGRDKEAENISHYYLGLVLSNPLFDARDISTYTRMARCLNGLAFC